MVKRATYDLRGKITSGTKVTNSQGKEHGKSLDHFNVSSFSELVGVYGQKPKTLLLTFINAKPEDVFHTEYNTWGGKTGRGIKKRSCDGSQCRLNLTQDIAGQKYTPGIYDCVCDALELPPAGPDSERCACYTMMTAMVIDPNSGTVVNHVPYRFETHSRNSSDALWTTLSETYDVYKTIKGIVFALRVNMVKSVDDDQPRNYPLWKMQRIGTPQQLLDAAESSVIPIDERSSVVGMLQSGDGAPLDLDGVTIQSVDEVAVVRQQIKDRIKEYGPELVSEQLLTKVQESMTMEAIEERYGIKEGETLPLDIMVQMSQSLSRSQE
jgi:hypothetical protein